MSVTTHDHAHDHHDHKPGFVARWLFSTNHKDIGTLYLIEAIFAGVLGGLFSAAMRAELAEPGVQFFHSAHAFNAIATAHGVIMIFFMIMPARTGETAQVWSRCAMAAAWIRRWG